MSLHQLFVPAGFVIGGLAGFVTRPSHLGMQAPLGVLFSNHPADAPFRSELMMHLGIYSVIGLVGGAVVFAIVQSILSSRKANP